MRVSFADIGLAPEIEKLRMQEYAKASGFALDLNTLRWKTSDNESHIMVAKDGDLLISTMRGEVIQDLDLLEKKLECPWTYPLALDMPVLLLSRAATASEHRTAGLNLILRYWFLRFAIAHGIRFVIGTFVTGSPRETSLREMGYQFFENPLGWQQSTYRSLRKVNVVALDLQSNGRQAIEYCLERANILPFEGNFPPLKFVRNI